MRLKAELVGAPDSAEMQRRRDWIRAIDRARVEVNDFDVVSVVREMRERSADLSEYSGER